ncbi:MAG TPA: lipopolysaccharide assembly protein LapA domain-containing protein [Chitinispirillaceae bacterium]|nr:lipopolysaccharide assembly protein LapA domain-containing protein [Chitinispirillaceae bacterium]
MRFLKWSILFVAAFMVAWILIFTFTQEPFKILVPARVLAYQTPPMPVYIYVAGAFGAGLLIGLWVALYYFIVQARHLKSKSKEVSSLEEQLVQHKNELERFQAELDRKNEQLEQLSHQENRDDQA